MFFFFLEISNSEAQIYIELMKTTDMSYDEIVVETEKYFDKAGRGKGTGYKQFERWKYWGQRSLNDEGRVVTSREALEEYKKYLQSNPPNKGITGNYTELGPDQATNTSTWSSHLGRVSAIGLDPNDNTHIIVGSPTGGMWKTNNTGSTWTQIFDDESLIDVYSLEISHANSNHYFAGLDQDAVRSTDGGTSWMGVTGLAAADRYNTMVMHPTNSNILFAVGEFFGRIYKSTDGGANWAMEYNHSGRLYDLEFKPGDPTTMYASGEGLVLKSTDTGDNWSALTGPWNGTGDIMLAVTDHDASYLFALQEDSGGFGGLYRSTNSGTSWTTQSDDSCNCNNIMGYNQSEKGGQAPRDMDVVVSPVDKDEVHVAGVETWRSYNGGSTWTQTTDWHLADPKPFIHADIDILIYSGSRLYAGTDGGIFYSTDEADSFMDISQGLAVRQFYRIGASETEADRVSGGSQDNGTGIYKSGTWYDWLGADGMETFISWNDKDLVYGNVQYGSLYKSTNGGTSYTYPAQVPGGGTGFRGAWVTPTEQDPTNASTLYQGKYELYKSTNNAGSWSAISSFGHSGSNYCSEIEIAPSNNQVIYASWGSTLYTTTNGGTSWTDVSPGGWINYIDVHPTDPNRVAVTISGTSGQVMESTDGGSNWTDISAGLPSINIECVIYENDGNLGMFVGGNPGIYHKDNNSGSFSDISMNLPMVRVTEFDIRNGIMYIGTYGRGLWKGTLDTPTCPADYAGPNALSGAQNTSADYETDGAIESSQVISGGSTVVDYDSGTSVTLTNGFEVDLGAVLNIFIDGCGNLLKEDNQSEN